MTASKNPLWKQFLGRRYSKVLRSSYTLPIDGKHRWLRRRFVYPYLVENIVTKVEIARFEQFLLFSQRFQRSTA